MNKGVPHSSVRRLVGRSTHYDCNCLYNKAYSSFMEVLRSWVHSSSLTQTTAQAHSFTVIHTLQRVYRCLLIHEHYHYFFQQAPLTLYSGGGREESIALFWAFKMLHLSSPCHRKVQSRRENNRSVKGFSQVKRQCVVSLTMRSPDRDKQLSC